MIIAAADADAIYAMITPLLLLLCHYAAMPCHAR